MWPNYRCRVSLEGWSLTDPTGREVTDRSCSGVWFRKPGAYLTPEPRGTDVEERWAMAQVQTVVDCLVSWARNNGRLLLVDPLAERRVDKLFQLQTASRYFIVPETLVAWGGMLDFPGESAVVKSLASVGLDGGKFLFTKRVDPELLDPRWPWFLQREYHGFDVTAVFVEGEIFASQLDRSSFDGQDWRKHIYSKELPWTTCNLSFQEIQAVQALMADLRLPFGRLDFIRNPEGQLVFLEVNTNGEWGWLDDGRRGIFFAVQRAAEKLQKLG